MENNELILSFDVGTTAVKGALYTPAGKCLFCRGIGYAKSSGQPGWVEQNPEHWIDCIKAIIGQAAAHFDLKGIVSIGICSQVNTHVFVDGNGRALIDAIVWEDQRCVGVTEDLNAHMTQQSSAAGEAEGVPLDSSSLLSRAEWVKRFKPEVWRNTRYILSPKDYCIMRLTGAVVTDALSSVGLVDERDNYQSGLLALVDGLEQRLPPIQAIDRLVGEVKDDDWGIQKCCPVVTGTMDAWAALFGSGAFVQGRGFQVAGTSEILGLVSDQAHKASGIVTFPPYQGLYLHAGPTQAGGDALRWFAEAQGKSITAVLQGVEAAKRVVDPLIFLPYLMGERAPIWDPKARGAFIGLSKHHGVDSMARALMEGVAFSARHLLEHLEQAAGYRCNSLLISGGASRSNLWCQIKADIMNRTLHRVENIDTGTFGAALMAAAGVGIYRNLDEAAEQGVVINHSFAPQHDSDGRYDALYQAYRESYMQLGPVFEKLYGIGSLWTPDESAKATC